MSTGSGRPDPSLYIGRLSDGDAFRREAAAWSLGEIGSRRAARPLAGLLLRELASVERCGYVLNDDIVRIVLDSIRRVGGTDALFALMEALLVLFRARREPHPPPFALRASGGKSHSKNENWAKECPP